MAQSASEEARWEARAWLATALHEPGALVPLSTADDHGATRRTLLITLDALAGSADSPTGTCWVRLGENAPGRQGLRHMLVRAVKIARALEVSGIEEVVGLDCEAQRCARFVAWLMQPGAWRRRLVEQVLWILNPRHIRRIRREQLDHNDELRTLFQLGEPDVAAAAESANVPRADAADPVVHFLRLGQYAGVDPHPLFWTCWYADHFVSKQGGAAAWTHFSARIGGVLRPPNPFLLPSWYGRGAQAYREHRNPVLDLLMKARRGYDAPDPNPLFDQQWYRDRYGLDRSGHPSCLMHFLRTGAQFATSYFVARHPLIAQVWKTDCVTGPSTLPASFAQVSSAPTGKNKRVAVCSVVTGNYDAVGAVRVVDVGFDYFFITDCELPTRPTPWRPLVVRPASDDTVLESRRLKMQLHRLLPNSDRYDVLVYVDGNIDLVGSLQPLVDAFLGSGRDLGLVPHPFRRCAYVEAAAVILQERDEPENVWRNVDFLEQRQVPDDAGLYEMNLFMIRPGEASGRFLDLWWQHYQRLGRRDQLLVPAILQELAMPAFGLMQPGQSVRNHPSFQLRTHGRAAHGRVGGLSSSIASLTRATKAVAQSFSSFFSIRSLPEIATKAIALLKREGLSGLYGVMREEFVAESAYRRAAMRETTDAARDEARYARLRYRPRLSVLMPVYDPPERLLRDAIESVRRQGYPDWELCIADDASPSAHIRRVLEEVAEEDTRIRLVFRESNGHISAASNSALGLVTGEFVVLLDHDDELADDALLTLAEVISEHPEVDIIYSDEDKIDSSGRRHRAYFKPEWNPDLFCGQNLISHLGTYRTERVRAVGGFREGYEGSQDWDLAARIIDDQPPPRIYHIPRVLYHWRVIPGSTALNVDEKNYAISAARRTIEDHCRRNGWSVMLERVNSAQFRVRHYPVQPQPLVSLVLYNLEGQDTAMVLERLYDATTYRPLEFVLCGLAQFPELSTRVSKSACSMVGSPESGSLSNSLNRAVQVSHGEILCLFDTSLQPRSVDWLDELVGHACREEIGAVGGQQTDPRGLIRHAGYVLDDEQLVVEPYVGRAEGLSGYRNRARLVQNLSAVSGACLAVRRDVWDDVSGLDTERFADACVDIDLCLRLLDCGFCNLWTPYAVATATRAPYLQAALASAISKSSPVLQGLREEHAALLGDDPASNPNLEIRNGMPQFRVR